MAREKQEEEAADTGGWINTFADLMNLLLCFFVLLFSMSNVDADKYEQIVASMTESINVFDGGGSAIADGPFISTGTDQIVTLSEYFNEFEKSTDGSDNQNGEKSDGNTQKQGTTTEKYGQNDNNKGKDTDNQNNPDSNANSANNQNQQNANQSGSNQNQQGQTVNGESNNSGKDGDEGVKNQSGNTEGQGQNAQDNAAGNKGKDEESSVEKTDAVKEYLAKKSKEQKDKATELYSEVMDEAKKSNIEDQITVNMDKKYQYVQISLNGGILFDTGQATIRKSTSSLLAKVGDILKLYKKNTIRIEGHTDNVPISSGAFKNNMWLSTARATEVFEFLVNKKGLSAKNMEPSGRGAYDPIASNKTAKGRSQNRRVEIKIYTDK